MSAARNQGAHYTPREFTDSELMRDLRQAPMTPAERDRHYAACTSDNCGSGRKPCPTPQACVIDGTPPERALRFFARLAGLLIGGRP